MHTLQAQYLAAQAAYAIEYDRVFEDDSDLSDEHWAPYEQAEKALSQARYNLCEWGVKFAKSLPFCTSANKRLIDQMWDKAQTNGVVMHKLADIVIKLDYKS